MLAMLLSVLANIKILCVCVYQGNKCPVPSLQSYLPANQPRYVLVPGVILAQVQDFAFHMAECYEILVSPFLLSVEVPA